MLIAQPGLPTATALGTNKLGAVFGTASAAWRYVRHVRIDLRRLLPVFAAALVFSALGALVAISLPTEIFTPFVLVMLVGVGCSSRCDRASAGTCRRGRGRGSRPSRAW